MSWAGLDLRFGNRGTDSISYMSVGVPQGKIFIINPQSEITSETGVRIFHPDGVSKVAQKLAGGGTDATAGTSAGEVESSGYATMTDLVDHIFPFVETDVLTETGEWSPTLWARASPVARIIGFSCTRSHPSLCTTALSAETMLDLQTCVPVPQAFRRSTMWRRQTTATTT
jgi:hypothetical protein